MIGDTPARKCGAIFVCILALAAVACGGEETGETHEPRTARAPDGTAASRGTTPASTAGDALTPAEATVGPREETAMPASSIEETGSRPPPENPPEGVRTYPAGTNRNIKGIIRYDREPPTSGDHAPIWQNCGFYEEPVRNETAVHSLDHGAVWITYRPDLPQEQIQVLRGYGLERYVLVSPYPGLPAPVVVTAWRNQLYLDSANDPRLRQFVDQFRVSATAPRSGNGCTRGVGDPDLSG